MFAHVKTGLLVALACTTALAAPTPQDEVAGRGDASVCVRRSLPSFVLLYPNATPNKLLVFPSGGFIPPADL